MQRVFEFTCEGQIFFKESMGLNWNFPKAGEGGRGIRAQKTLCGIGLSIFSGTTHFQTLVAP